MSNYISKTWQHYRAQRGARREFFMLAIALLIGSVLVPLLIWGAGSLTLGPYARDPAAQQIGGPFALLGDFFHGLASGATGYWIVLLGPYVMYLTLRIAKRMLRA